jgi:hypothetical protein
LPAGDPSEELLRVHVEETARGAVHKRLSAAPPRAAAARSVRSEGVSHHGDVGRLVGEHLLVFDALACAQPWRVVLLAQVGVGGTALARLLL